MILQKAIFNILFRLYIYIYILVMSLLRVWMDPWIPASLPGGQNTLPEPPHGRAIPRWNRLGKKN